MRITMSNEVTLARMAVIEQPVSVPRNENVACAKLKSKLEPADVDGTPGVASEGALFTVRFLDVGGQFIAAAFSPNDPISRRRVVIDPSYFAAQPSFDPIGVLRHELGHVLGFRHEHIRQGAPIS